MTMEWSVRAWGSQGVDAHAVADDDLAAGRQCGGSLSANRGADVEDAVHALRGFNYLVLGRAADGYELSADPGEGIGLDVQGGAEVVGVGVKDSEFGLGHDKSPPIEGYGSRDIPDGQLAGILFGCGFLIER